MEPEQLLTEQEVHRITRVSKQTLKRWRKENVVLGWIKIGRSVRYKASEVFQLLNTERGANS